MSKHKTPFDKIRCSIFGDSVWIVIDDDGVEQKCPESCDDNDDCTEDKCSEKTDYSCVHTPITPCCGNGKCEEKESYETCSSDCEKPETDPAVEALLSKTSKVKSYEYLYMPGKNMDAMTVKLKGSKRKLEFSKERTGTSNC